MATIIMTVARNANCRAVRATVTAAKGKARRRVEEEGQP
jgi:hypothetical protein